VVGIDIARKKKERLAGTVNATAIARIYLGNGEFLRYVIHDTPLEGETIPNSVLQSLFPVREFSGKRVVIHRDGYFRGEEKVVLKSWAEQIDAQFHLVEIIKTGAPRIYGRSQQQTIQPEKGSTFLISPTEALLVSSLPPFKNATPRPFRICTEPPFTIAQALESVLAMTMLHYGSLRPPRLPVTIHYSDKIAYMALRGIKPKSLEGNIPFWL
jgi:argonaute-like protein implicated in RNA metabolism and viral defense